MLWRQLPEKSFGHQALNKKSNGIGWELGMCITEHGIARAKNLWKFIEYVQNIESCIFWHWWVWMSVGTQPAIQLSVG